MSGIYIHIPFCKSKCAYCDFYSVVDRGMAGELVAAVAREAAMRREELDGDAVKTLYIGGGTPSQLSQEHIGKIVEAIGENYDFNLLQEFTIEVNPDDVTSGYIAGLASTGVNRVSMGAQSFVDAELAAIGRRHDAEGAVRAIEAIREAGISNLSIDLIYGLPGQTLPSWRKSLETACGLKPEHISCYCLSYEPGTKLHYMRDKGIIKECDEDDCVAMFKAALEVLGGNGYEHYEISNFCKPGMYSAHNLGYWNGAKYLGLGPGAHSYDGASRSANVANLSRYIRLISNGAPACERETLSAGERYDEHVMLGLRTRWGVSVSEIRAKFGDAMAEHFLAEAGRYTRSGRMESRGDRYVLTERGVMVADMIIRDVML